jgi:hypothetical protein
VYVGVYVTAGLGSLWMIFLVTTMITGRFGFAAADCTGPVLPSAWADLG